MKRRSAELPAGPVADWFHQRFPNGFSAIQKAALPYTTAGRNTLILAPTGSGKTLAAFLAVIAKLEAEARRGTLTNTIRAVYVSPLRSLTRDMHRNLSELAERFNVRVEVRTGDTDPADRSRLQRKPPHLLLTTPESLSALLSQRGFANAWQPSTVIVDEIHSFAENKRGSLLTLTIERLERHATAGLQRIGLSATAYPIEAVQRLLCGDRDCAIASVDLKKTHRLEISRLRDDTVLPASTPAAGTKRGCTADFSATT